MTEPAKRVPRWLTIDVIVLVVGAVIMIATALWLEPRDGLVQRLAQSTGQQLWQYVTERRKPVVPKLKAPL
jgi:uncharacterized membrane protein YczE